MKFSVKEKRFDLSNPRNKKILSLAVSLTVGLIITVLLVIFMPKKGEDRSHLKKLNWFNSQRIPPSSSGNPPLGAKCPWT